jgi:urea transporter
MDIGRLSNSLADGILSAATQPVEAWLTEHPLLLWLVTHPVWLFIVALLSILLLVGLIRAIGHLTEKIWLVLLRLPLQLVRWFLIQLSKLLKIGFIKTVAQSNQQQRLAEVLSRLEVLRQEQEALMQELKTMLANQD